MVNTSYAKTILSFLLALVFPVALFAQVQVKVSNQPQRDYESVPGDPIDARIYTLDNGLKVYLSVNKRAPRIQTFIAVRAGSKNDPAETTGLAHYLEHMMFKGTHSYGTLSWEEEKVYLDKISELYEEHRNAKDSTKKKQIYKIIDSLSYEASKLAIPNEYDKMISSLGAKGTNAFTSVEQTVYVNNIPSNELEKWLMVESERFQTLVLRLFHTELETVYEEFNRGQDNDYRKSWQALYKGLFPSHPYGTQTTIGKGEHLKNPSMVNIHKYFDTYYVPDNIAICLSGDLNPEETIRLIRKYFGNWQPKPVPEFTYEDQPDIKSPKEIEVFGVQPEHLYLGFRFDGAGSREAKMVKLVDAILSNGQAGLIDLNLVQQQKVLKASSFKNIMADYTVHGFYGVPREGQTLEQVKDLLLSQLELIKKGEFEDWMLDAVIKNMELNRIKAFEGNRARAGKFVDAFTLGLKWEDIVHELDDLKKITKAELVDFVKTHYDDNYVVVYKRYGKDPNVFKVKKPEITPVVMNRDQQSRFFAHFDSMESSRLKPKFVDFDKEISKTTIDKNIDFYYIRNKFNGLFQLYYIFDMGKDNNRYLPLAIKYLPYLGTDQYTAEELQKEFFKLGLSFGVHTGRDKVYVTLSGLEESLKEGLKLFEHILENAQPNKQAYSDMVEGILKERADAKLSKRKILRSAMTSYAKYGPNSPFRNILSEKELKKTKPEKLVNKIHELTAYKHRIFYYGQKGMDDAAKKIEQYHHVPETPKDYPEPVEYKELETDENKVYFVDYDMVQTEILMLSKGPSFDEAWVPYADLFNEYFGAGLSSIVFQDIREAKALAYSAYSYISVPRKKEQSHYVAAYIGTQTDKLQDAVQAMLDLMHDMPKAPNQYDAAEVAALKKIESERIVGANIYWSYERAKNRGIDYDLREKVYKRIPNITVQDLKEFFNKNVKGRKYTFLVLGKKEDMDMKALRSLGPVEELSLKTLFNY